MRRKPHVDRELYLLCLGRVLMQLRGSRHQVAIARAAAMPQGTLSRFENGQIEFGLHRLRQLAAALGVAPHTVIEIAEQCFAKANDIRRRLERTAEAPPALGLAMMATAHVPSAEKCSDSGVRHALRLGRTP